MRNKKLGTKLKGLRKEKKLSRQDLSELFDITTGAIGMYEQGRRVPKDDIKKKYSIYFNKSVDEIFFN